MRSILKNSNPNSIPKLLMNIRYNTGYFNALARDVLNLTHHLLFDIERADPEDHLDEDPDQLYLCLYRNLKYDSRLYNDKLLISHYSGKSRISFPISRLSISGVYIINPNRCGEDVGLSGKEMYKINKYEGETKK
jgi:hypothetical protein